MWAAAYGGAQTTDGSTTAGSNATTSRVYGTAVGADYRISPDTLAGFALAGGGTNFGVNGLGSGRSDLFQAGAYLRHTVGAAYVTAALAYGWQDVTTDRTVTIAGVDQLRANFNANAWSGRVESGYRFVTPWTIGITPYAAAQFTTFALPAYAESVVSGAGTFALAYNAKTSPPRAANSACAATSRSRCRTVSLPCVAAPHGRTTSTPTAASRRRSRPCRVRRSWSTARRRRMIPRLRPAPPR